jgi:hypothetical protein
MHANGLAYRIYSAFRAVVPAIYGRCISISCQVDCQTSQSCAQSFPLVDLTMFEPRELEVLIIGAGA